MELVAFLFEKKGPKTHSRHLSNGGLFVNAHFGENDNMKNEFQLMAGACLNFKAIRRNH